MNTYKITFTRENGTVGSDNFTAPSEAQARRLRDAHQLLPRLPARGQAHLVRR